MMKLPEIEQRASDALQAVLAHEKKYGSTPVLKSIKNQMKFIRDCASAGKNPIRELPEGQTFTFGILSSREFSSPEELQVKEELNRVSRLLC
ncbi:immunity protein Tsi6 family protein [Microbulbifer agarilyticus]